MQLITAIIQPTKLSSVRDALQELGVDHITVCDAMGYGRQHGQTASFRGNEYRVDLLRKISIEVAVPDHDLDRVLAAVRKSAITGSEGQIGDGKVFVVPIVQAIDIGNSEPATESL